ncbi:DUF3817 domain-containing protein [Gordonia sp. CPCC 205333]|uniref:DUF3817 domain-containing protein n=1 Tax=Gordonia sp. CPCC 205333 TaxID=3140790 RepID=UPI003AF3E96B
MQIFDLTTPAKRFRFVAIAEAITWLALLIAMFFKWVLGHEEAVAIPGMVHAVVFVVFCVVALLTAWQLKWNLKVTALALVSSIPPFGTLVFEWWAARNGHLAELSTDNSDDATTAITA